MQHMGLHAPCLQWSLNPFVSSRKLPNTCTQPPPLNVTRQHWPDAGSPIRVAAVHLGAGCQPDGGPGYGTARRGDGFAGLVGVRTTRQQPTGVAPAVPRAVEDEGLGSAAESGIHATLWRKVFEADLVV